MSQQSTTAPSQNSKETLRVSGPRVPHETITDTPNAAATPAAALEHGQLVERSAAEWADLARDAAERSVDVARAPEVLSQPKAASDPHDEPVTQAVAEATPERSGYTELALAQRLTHQIMVLRTATVSAISSSR